MPDLLLKILFVIAGVRTPYDNDTSKATCDELT
jgi:hypothetical protein